MGRAVQSAEEVKQKAEAGVAKAESRAMALQQQLVLLQLRLQEQGQLIRESTHQEARLESQLQEIRMELKVTETREHELRALAAQLEVESVWHAACRSFPKHDPAQSMAHHRSQPPDIGPPGCQHARHQKHGVARCQHHGTGAQLVRST